MVRRKTFAKKGISATPKSDSKTVVHVRDHEFVMDEVWGTNEGPSPVETMLASQAGCLNVIGSRVANDMEIEIDIVEIEISGELDIRKLDGRSDEPRAGIQEISVDIRVATEEDAATISEWIEATEERCPVTDNLVGETPCVVSLEVD